MGILVKKQEGSYNFTKIAKISFVGLIVTIAAACTDTIWAVYMNSFINNIAYVGFISSFLSAISFISYFLIIPIIEKSNKAKIYSYTLLLFILTYLLFAINHNFYLFLILAIFITVLYTLRISSFGIIIRDNSKDNEVSNNEGLIYTFLNLAWVIGPLIAGFVASVFGINKVFFLSALFIFIGLVVFRISKIKDSKGKKKTDKRLLKNFIDFFKCKDKVVAYALRGGVSLWWSFLYLFIPLLILRSGIGEVWIGYFLSGVAIPLILLSYLFAKLAGKHGFKKLFKIGYLIVAIIGFVCFFIPNIYMVLILLIIASVGMAMLEATTEAYFFDILKGKERYRFYSPYSTAIDAGHFIGKISASVLLLLLPFNFLYILYGGFMLLLFLLSFKTKYIAECRRK